MSDRDLIDMSTRFLKQQVNQSLEKNRPSEPFVQTAGCGCPSVDSIFLLGLNEEAQMSSFKATCAY